MLVKASELHIPPKEVVLFHGKHQKTVVDVKSSITSLK